MDMQCFLTAQKSDPPPFMKKSSKSTLSIPKKSLCKLQLNFIIYVVNVAPKTVVLDKSQVIIFNKK